MTLGLRIHSLQWHGVRSFSYFINKLKEICLVLERSAFTVCIVCTVDDGAFICSLEMAITATVTAHEFYPIIINFYGLFLPDVFVSPN